MTGTADCRAGMRVVRVFRLGGCLGRAFRSAFGPILGLLLAFEVSEPSPVWAQVGASDSKGIDLPVKLAKGLGGFFHIPIRANPFNLDWLPEQLNFHRFVPLRRPQTDTDCPFHTASSRLHPQREHPARAGNSDGPDRCLIRPRLPCTSILECTRAHQRDEAMKEHPL